MANNFWSLMVEARNKYSAGELDAAVEAYTATLASANMDSQRWDVYFERGMIYYALGNPQAAASDFDQTRTLTGIVPPFWIRLYFYSGCARAALDNFDGASADFAAVMQACLKPNTANDYEFIIGVENLQRAIADVDRVIEHKPETAAYFSRGLAKRNCKDWVGALADYQAARELDESNMRLREWLFAQDILQHGAPTPYEYYRPHIRADLQYQNVYKQFDLRRVLAVYFDDTTTTETVIAPADDAQFREQLKRDGWVLLKSGGNKEGDDSHYVRIKS